MADRRGDAIGFIAGCYIGYTGWTDKSKDQTPAMIPVIVHGFKKANGNTVDKATRVRKTSVAFGAPAVPTNFEEATLQQHPKIEDVMVKLCRQLAKCGIYHESNVIRDIFSAKLRDEVARQVALGSNAEWKKAEFADATASTQM
jgi:hypothetical protein